jgi:hypothetical protein
MAEKNRKPGRDGRPGRRWPLGRLARKRRLIGAAAFIGVGLIIFVLVWFQPQKLLLNKTVNESVPGVIQTAQAGETSRNATADASPPGLHVLRSGSFRSLEHPTMGTAIVLRRPAGRLILRLEHLSTSNGPDLRVYLSHVPAQLCTPTRPDSSTWARSRATEATRTMPSRQAPTCRHSRARSSGAAGSQSDSA